MAIKDSVEIPCVTKEACELKEGDVFVRHDFADRPRLVKVHSLDVSNDNEHYVAFVSEDIGSGELRLDFLSTVAHCHIIASA